MHLLDKWVSTFFTKAEKILKHHLRLLPYPVLTIATTIIFFYLGATIGIVLIKLGIWFTHIRGFFDTFPLDLDSHNWLLVLGKLNLHGGSWSCWDIWPYWGTDHAGVLIILGYWSCWGIWSYWGIWSLWGTYWSCWATKVFQGGHRLGPAWTAWGLALAETAPTCTVVAYLDRAASTL